MPWVPLLENGDPVFPRRSDTTAKPYPAESESPVFFLPVPVGDSYSDDYGDQSAQDQPDVYGGFISDNQGVVDQEDDDDYVYYGNDKDSEVYDETEASYHTKSVYTSAKHGSVGMSVESKEQKEVETSDSEQNQDEKKKQNKKKKDKKKK